MNLAGVRGFEPLNMVLHTTITFVTLTVCGLEYIFTLQKYLIGIAVN